MTSVTTTRLTVAVIVCAYTLERLDDLTDCIDALHAQDSPPDELVCVTDNNMLLATRLRKLADVRKWDVRVIGNRSTPGLSGARNTGVAATTSDLAVFIDDDAVAESGWLRELVAPFDDPTTSAVGGRIEPGWPDDRPPWFPPHLDWTVGCSIPTLPADGGPIRNMYGASAAFRRSALEAVGGFPTELGRVGANGAGCEETEMCIRIRQLSTSAQVMYAPRSRVTHRVTEERATVAIRPPTLPGRGAFQGDPQPARRCRRRDQRRTQLRRRDRPRRRAATCAQPCGHRPTRRRAVVLIAGLATAATGYTLEGIRRR